MVPGDIPPMLVTKFHLALAVPLRSIINSIKNDHVWPSAWKIEYVTAIPKCPVPSTVQELRNIGCTNLFSKIAESFVLTWTKEEVDRNMKSNQYGG